MKIIEIIGISICSGFLFGWLVFGAMMLQERKTVWPLALFIIAIGIVLLFTIR